MGAVRRAAVIDASLWSNDEIVFNGCNAGSMPRPAQHIIPLIQASPGSV